jgi:hypothetical protein
LLIVFEKNPRQQTAEGAKGMNQFNPDITWRPAETLKRMEKPRNRLTALHIMAAGLAVILAVTGTGRAESLEEQTRRPLGTNSLNDDSEHLNGNVAPPPTDSLDNDSMNLRGRTADQDGTNSLDDGSMDSGNDPDSD